MNTITVICAWCDKLMGTKKADRKIKSESDSISHGMCNECHEEVLEEMNTSNGQFSESEE